MNHALIKTVAVSVCSTILATLAVNAIDMQGNMASTLLASLLGSSEKATTEVCPQNMVLVTQALVPFCVDAYEASAGASCPFAAPASGDETALNLTVEGCGAASVPQARPWTYVSQDQAVQACSRVGKRLLTANEWYKAALGTPDVSAGWGDESCNVARNLEDGAAEGGSGMRCVSDSGAYDMVGNVWEWVDETVAYGTLYERAVPQTGFVTGVDTDGLAFATESAASDRFGGDRFWSDRTLVAGVMRGGYYDGRASAGIFSTYAASPPTFTGEAVGFRCAVTPHM